MNGTTQLTTFQNRDYGAILEKVILKNDLSDLTPQERVLHIKRLCETLRLNPETQPIQIIEFETWDSDLKKKVKKVIPYFSKDGGAQLLKRDDISITRLETEMLAGGIYVVRAYASTPSGRTDCATGVKSLGELKGKGLENAMKTAETQAKRRVALSICGLGLIDESEIEDIKGAQTIEPSHLQQAIANKKEQLTIAQEKKPIIEEVNSDHEDMLLAISQCDSTQSLETVYRECYNVLIKSRDRVGLTKLNKARDKKRDELEKIVVKDFNLEIDEAEKAEKEEKDHE